MMVFQSFQTSSGLTSVSFLYGSCADETSIILLWFLCPPRDPVYPLSKYFLFMVVVKTYVRFQTKTIGVYLPVLATIFVGYCVLLCAIGAPSTTKQVQVSTVVRQPGGNRHRIPPATCFRVRRRETVRSVAPAQSDL